MVDVACRSRWARAARGVVALLIEGGVCSGSLLNTVPPHATSPAAADGSSVGGGGNGGALLLTAYHCVRPLIERWEAEAREAREAREVAGEEEEEAVEEEETVGRFVPISVLFNWQACTAQHLIHAHARCRPMPCPWCAHDMHSVCP